MLRLRRISGDCAADGRKPTRKRRKPGWLLFAGDWTNGAVFSVGRAPLCGHSCGHANGRVQIPESDVNNEPQPKGRIDAIDIARGAALVAMAIYHFAWDLEFFGYVPAGMTAVGGWKLFARSDRLELPVPRRRQPVPRSCKGHPLERFLAAAGDGRGRGARNHAGYLRRYARQLHLLRHPASDRAGERARPRLPAAAGSIVTLLVAAAVIAAPHYLRSTFFDDPWWWWTGLSENRPRSNDFVPVFPWFAAVLAGIAAAKIATRTGSARQARHNARASLDMAAQLSADATAWRSILSISRC